MHFPRYKILIWHKPRFQVPKIGARQSLKLGVGILLLLLRRPPMTPLASADTSRCFPILLESSGTVLIDAAYRQVGYLMLM